MNTTEHKPYNLYNLEPQFKTYLSAVKKLKKISIKNYLSDFRHFAGWITLKTHLEKRFDTVSSLLTHDKLVEYRTYLTDNDLPKRTVNRRLSTIRQLCQFCIQSGYINTNPSHTIRNIAVISKAKLWEEYVSELIEKNDVNDVAEIRKDLREFISIIQSQS